MPQSETTKGKIGLLSLIDVFPILILVVLSGYVHMANITFCTSICTIFVLFYNKVVKILNKITIFKQIKKLPERKTILSLYAPQVVSMFFILSSRIKIYDTCFASQTDSNDTLLRERYYLQWIYNLIYLFKCSFVLQFGMNILALHSLPINFLETKSYTCFFLLAF